MADNGLHVQRFKVAESGKEAVAIAKELNAKEFVLKAQILAGGRGKGTFTSGLQGGVHLTSDPEKIGELTDQMVGYNLTTKQTPPDGVLVQKVMVAESYDISRETYLAILMDRGYQGPVIVGSPKGGVDIEEVAEKTPEHIHKVAVDIFKGITDEDARYLAEKLEFQGPLLEEAAEQIKALYKLFLKVDATQVEINPFGETPDGKVVCFDAKFNFDDSAKFRQQEVFAMDDQSESDPREVEAGKYDLNYIGLDGNIACLVNGAGLAMATMDIIKLHGGTPANFLDLGGGVKEEGVFQAFNIVTKDPRVKSILVNIFGGIVNCATVADGITSAYKKLKVNVPVVVRLDLTMASMKEKCLQVALAAARYGDSWWLPFVLLAVCTVNSITGGVLTWSVGILQMALFNIIVLSRKYTFVVGPLMLSSGSLIAGYFYVQMMKSDGADALLAYAGVNDSTWLTKAQTYANDWGVLGLVGMQVVPIPIPSAVIVIAGMMAKMNEVKILVTVYVSKFIQLTLGAIALKYATENQTPEEFIRQQMGAGEQETDEKED